MSGNLGDDLKKLMLAGVGAIAVVTEKSKEWIDEFSKKGEDTTQRSKEILDDLAEKGETALEQGKILNEELKAKVQKAFERAKDEAEQLDFEELADSLGGMTDEALNALKSRLDELVESRANRQNEEASPEESCCEEGCSCEESNSNDGQCEQ